MSRTLTEKRLTELLKYSEADICDFKERIYNIEDEGSKVSFLKDILSMANTIRYEPAYIIIGICQKDGHNEFLDVDPNIDENNFISFIKGNVGPEYPEFTYYTMKYKKHNVGVFEIGISKSEPFISKKSYGVTRHFIVDEKSILFSTVSTPLRHLHFADRTLLSTKLCSQIKIFRLELCVQ